MDFLAQQVWCAFTNRNANHAAPVGGLYFEMTQPPVVFGHFMCELSAVTYFLFPFEPMWLMARRDLTDCPAC